MTEQEYWFWLCNIEELDSKKRRELVKRFGSAEALFRAKRGELSAAELTERQLAGILRNRNEDAVNVMQEAQKRAGIRFVGIGDEEYPERLRHIYDPPSGLFIKGKLPEEDRLSIAVVGARAPSAYGAEVAEYFASQLASAGAAVVSGLASGLDARSHAGALRAGGYTAAVLGNGADICYPRENFNLYLKIGETGGIISEYPPGSQPLKHHFPARNRIISGLSDGILIVEARKKSGSLITAELGLEQGKEIFAVPGRLGDVMSVGCNELIRAGAKLVMSPDDILQEFVRFFSENYNDCGRNQKFYNNLLETREKIVYANLSLAPKHIDRLSLECGFSVQELAAILLLLELKGMIRQTDQNYYALCPELCLNQSEG